MKSLCALILVAGCSGGTSESPVIVPAGCQTKLAECRAIQQICVAGGTCQVCAEGEYASKANVCSPIGTPLTHDFPVFTAQAGQELLGTCRSWSLQNPAEIWVNAVELTQDEASHHSNWLFVPDDKYPGPDGTWRCRDRGYEQLGAALAGGVLYAQSTQATHEVQKFPNGAAVRLPPYVKIISDVHVLNASSQPVTGHARLSLYTLDAKDVKIRLAPFHLGFEELSIPPSQESRAKGSCELDSSFQSAFNHGVNAKVYYILPHFHALGFHFFVERMGGARDGESIFDSQGAVGEARGRAFDPPIDLSGVEGLKFGCDFDNPTDKTVRWGFGDQEMCELLGFSDSPLAWTSSVHDLSVDATATAITTMTGPCATVAFEYDFTKAGGPPR